MTRFQWHKDKYIRDPTHVETLMKVHPPKKFQFAYKHDKPKVSQPRVDKNRITLAPISMENKMKPLLPQRININGTSRADLLTAYMHINNAFRTLDQALGEAMPHGRDYSDEYNDARTAWDERRKTLETIRKEFEACAERVAAQGHGRLYNRD